MSCPRSVLQGALALGLLLGLSAAWAADPVGGLNLSLPPEAEAPGAAGNPADALPQENRPKPYQRGRFESSPAEALPYGAGYEARQLQSGGGMAGGAGRGGRGPGRGR